jgi:hypothetical protein
MLLLAVFHVAKEYKVVMSVFETKGVRECSFVLERRDETSLSFALISYKKINVIKENRERERERERESKRTTNPNDAKK